MCQYPLSKLSDHSDAERLWRKQIFQWLLSYCQLLLAIFRHSVSFGKVQMNLGNYLVSPFWMSQWYIRIQIQFPERGRGKVLALRIIFIMLAMTHFNVATSYFSLLFSRLPCPLLLLSLLSFFPSHSIIFLLSVAAPVCFNDQIQ